MKFNPGFRGRQRRHREAIDGMRNPNVKETLRWDTTAGDYRTDIYSGNYLESPREDNEQLSGVERVLLQQIQGVYKKKRDAGDTSPVIALDFGGMFSMSFMRLARSAELESLCQSGDIILAVSNVEYVPDVSKLRDDKEYVRLHRPDVDFVEENMSRLQFVKGEAQELGRATVQIPGTETTIALRGNVDVLHESSAITTMNKPETDIPRMGALMSDYGTMLTAGVKAFAEDSNWDVGFQNLAELDLSRVELDPSRSQNYRIHTKPGAPALQLG